MNLTTRIGGGLTIAAIIFAITMSSAPAAIKAAPKRTAVPKAQAAKPATKTAAKPKSPAVRKTTTAATKKK